MMPGIRAAMWPQQALAWHRSPWRFTSLYRLAEEMNVPIV